MVIRSIGFCTLVAFTIVSVCFALPAYAQEKSEASKKMDKPTMRFIETNGLRMRIAEMGEGPLVVLVHGWPESWYSWRHQIPALAAAGYHVVAPDMRGYGKTDAPEGVENYDVHHLTADIVGVVKAVGEETAVVVGHDWGAIVAWQCALLHPKTFSAAVAMIRSVAAENQSRSRVLSRSALGLARVGCSRLRRART